MIVSELTQLKRERKATHKEIRRTNRKLNLSDHQLMIFCLNKDHLIELDKKIAAIESIEAPSTKKEKCK